MKTIIVVLIIFAATIFSSCGIFIPDYMENSERNDKLEYEKAVALAKAEKKVLDSAGIIATKSTTNQFIVDEFGRKLVIIANPHKSESQKVTIYNSGNELLYSGPLSPGQVVKEYLFQTLDEKLYCVWEMRNKKPYWVVKDFPEGPANQQYNGERCHAYTYGWPSSF